VILDSKTSPEEMPQLTISKNGIAGEESLARLLCKETSIDLIAGQNILQVMLSFPTIWKICMLLISRRMAGK